MYTKCPVTKLMKNYRLFSFWWFKSLYPALTTHIIPVISKLLEMIVHDQLYISLQDHSLF